MLAQGLQMVGGGVTFVASQAVLGVDRVPFLHAQRRDEFWPECEAAAMDTLRASPWINDFCSISTSSLMASSNK